jgi:hypothetical protein
VLQDAGVAADPEPAENGRAVVGRRAVEDLARRCFAEGLEADAQEDVSLLTCQLAADRL